MHINYWLSYACVSIAETSDAHAELSEAQKKRKLTVKDVFSADDERTEEKKKRPLVPLGEPALPHHSCLQQLGWEAANRMCRHI